MVHYQSLLMERLWLTERVAIAGTDLIGVEVLVWLPASSVKEGEVCVKATCFCLWSGALGHRGIEYCHFASLLCPLVWFCPVFWFPKTETGSGSPAWIVKV